MPKIDKLLSKMSVAATSKRAVCRNCGVTVKYLPSEVKRYDGHDYSGGPDGCTWVECPGCNERIILESW